MIRPGLTFVLWLAIALFIVLSTTWSATPGSARPLSVRAVEWYKVLVPLPYVAMLARHPCPPHGRAALARGGAARRAAVAGLDGAGRLPLRARSPMTTSRRPSSTASPSGGARPIRCWCWPVCRSAARRRGVQDDGQAIKYLCLIYLNFTSILVMFNPTSESARRMRPSLRSISTVEPRENPIISAPEIPENHQATENT